MASVTEQIEWQRSMALPRLVTNSPVEFLNIETQHSVTHGLIPKRHIAPQAYASMSACRGPSKHMHCKPKLAEQIGPSSRSRLARGCLQSVQMVKFLIKSRNQIFTQADWIAS